MSLEAKLAKIEKQVKISFAEEPTEKDLRLLTLLHNLLCFRKDPEYLSQVWKKKYQRNSEKIMKAIESYIRSLAEGSKEK